MSKQSIERSSSEAELSNEAETVEAIETEKTASQHDTSDTGQSIDLFPTGGDRGPVSSSTLGDFERQWVAGQRIEGRYELKMRLGFGGMGEVWKAWDREAQRDVALKHLSCSQAPDAFRRFEREVQILQRLAHPGVVKILDFCPRSFCYVMELLEGETLRSLLQREKRLTMEQTLSLLQELCETLSDTHKQGLIHRDLKPENLFLCAAPEGKARSLKILDFGIAFVEETTRYTQQPGGFGTAYYMAPEQLRGDAPPSPASDIYSCGVLLYEFLVGHTPLLGARPLDEHLRRLGEHGIDTNHACPPELFDAYLQQLQRLQRLYRKAVDEDADVRCSLRDFAMTLALVEESWCQARKRGKMQRYQQVNLLLTKETELKKRQQAVTEAMADYPEEAGWEALQRLVFLHPDAPQLVHQDEESVALTQQQTQLPLSSFVPMEASRGAPPVVLAHQSPVRALATDPSEAWLAVGCENGGLSLWSLAKRKRVQHEDAHHARILALAFSPDGRWLATASDDRRVLLWSRGRRWKCKHQLEAHIGGVRAVAFSPDGTQMATASSDNTVRLWHVPSFTVQQVLRGHRGAVRSVAFSENGQWLASASQDGDVRIWDRHTGLCSMTLTSGDAAWCVRFSPHPHMLVVGHKSGDICLWDFSAQQVLQRLSGHESGVMDFYLSPALEMLVSASADTQIKLWDLGRGESVESLRQHHGGVAGLVPLQGGEQILSGSFDCQVLLWQRQSRSLPGLEQSTHTPKVAPKRRGGLHRLLWWVTWLALIGGLLYMFSDVPLF